MCLEYLHLLDCLLFDFDFDFLLELELLQVQLLGHKLLEIFFLKKRQVHFLLELEGNYFH